MILLKGDFMMKNNSISKSGLRFNTKGMKAFKNILIHYIGNVVFFLTFIYFAQNHISYQNAILTSILIIFTCVATAYSFVCNLWRIGEVKPTMLQRICSTGFISFSFVAINLFILKFFLMQ